jgi:hypothetical protein
MSELFKDFKDKVSVEDVAYSLGYRLDRRAGIGRYVEMNIRDGAGRKADAIIISRLHDRKDQRYFHRNGSRGGDVIDLIRENLPAFGASGASEGEQLLNAMARLSGGEALHGEPALAECKDLPRAPFDERRFIMEPASENLENVMHYFRYRNIADETVERFKPFLFLVTDTKAKYKFRNLGFPYRQPGSDKIAGFELRGYQDFKSKATGTDSTHAAWIADFTEGHPEQAASLFFAESGYDIMSFYQCNWRKISLAGSVFVSLGGSFSNMQLRGIADYYGNAHVFDCCDNDLAGRIYGIRMESVLDGRHLDIAVSGDEVIISDRTGKEEKLPAEEVTLDNVKKLFCLWPQDSVCTWKPPKDYKDWNDVLLGRRMSTLHVKMKSSYEAERRKPSAGSCKLKR